MPKGFAALLDALGVAPGERVAVCHRHPAAGRLEVSHGTAADAPARARPYIGRADVWFSVCPLRPDAVLAPGERGKASDVGRIPALFADLDAKPAPAGLGSVANCRDAVQTLSECLYAQPVAVVASGSGGLHPYWRLAPYPPAEHPRAVRLLRRFGLLVRAVATAHGGGADNVQEPARVLRVPGTRNLKPDGGAVVAEFPDAETVADVVTLDDLEEALSLAGIPDAPDAEDLAERVDASTWTPAAATCGYASRMVSGWASDVPSAGRHQWLMGQAVRLEAARRHGCLTVAAYGDARRALADRFGVLCATVGPSRSPAPFEVAGALAWARERVETMTPAAVAGQLGNHRHRDDTPPPGVDPETGELREPPDEDVPPPAEDDVQDVPAAWGEPAPLGVALEAPALPLDGLPPYLREMVDAVTEQSQAPREVVLAAALGALAAATRGAWDVEVHSGWRAGPSVLWTLTLATSGERKDSGVSPLFAPLEQAEREAVAEVRTVNRNRAAERERIVNRRKDAEREGNGDEVARQREAEHRNRPRPVPAFLVSDPTPEALGMSMGEGGGSACIVGTEAASLQTVAGRYSDAGGNYSLVNHAYDGARFSDLRIRRDPIRVDRPALSWCVAVQPSVVAGYANAGSEGSGFLPRFLLLLAENRVGSRSYRTPAVPAGVSARWAAVVHRLHAAAWERYSAMTEDLPDTLGPAPRIRFTEDAAEALIQYAERLEAQKRPGSVLVTLGGWVEKHPTRVARIAAILALADDPERTSVPVEYVRAALSLADPLIRHALAAFDVLRHAARQDPPSRVAEILRRLGKPTATTRGVFLLARAQSWCDHTEDARDALEELADLGWVRGPVKVQTGGRPSERWDVHPELLPKV